MQSCVFILNRTWTMIALFRNKQSVVLLVSNNSLPHREAEGEEYCSPQQHTWHNTVPHGAVASTNKIYTCIALHMDAVCADAARAALAAVGLSHVGPCLPYLSSGAQWLYIVQVAIALLPIFVLLPTVDRGRVSLLPTCGLYFFTGERDINFAWNALTIIL